MGAIFSIRTLVQILSQASPKCPAADKVQWGAAVLHPLFIITPPGIDAQVVAQLSSLSVLSEYEFLFVTKNCQARQNEIHTVQTERYRFEYPTVFRNSCIVFYYINLVFIIEILIIKNLTLSGNEKIVNYLKEKLTII